MKLLKYFTSNLITWYKLNKRDLPWRDTNDPYKIWLSEVILQQTQVSFGLKYYEKFLAHFPNIFTLAYASENQVLKLWQGLGYYSRARNLHYTARIIVQDHQGQFPREFHQLKKLKGIGEYTAGAIAAFAFKANTPAIDGNVLRLLSRFFYIKKPINETKYHKIFRRIIIASFKFIPAYLLNQAFMEFAALHCKVANPLCQTCPIQSKCQAFKRLMVSQLPFKSKKVKLQEYYFDYFIILRNDNNIFIRQNIQKGIWHHLYEFYKVQHYQHFNKLSKTKLSQILSDINTKNIDNIQTLYDKPIIHKLTHRKISAKFWIIKTNIDFNIKDCQTVHYLDFEKLAMPILIAKAYKEFLRQATKI